MPSGTANSRVIRTNFWGYFSRFISRTAGLKNVVMGTWHYWGGNTTIGPRCSACRRIARPVGDGIIDYSIKRARQQTHKRPRIRDVSPSKESMAEQQMTIDRS